MAFNNVYNGKRILITGNTGFKGSWLSVWLNLLGADVYGYSLDIPTDPSMFVALNLGKIIKHEFGDIRDREHLEKTINNIRPDFIFHLAAQAIVSRSYREPVETISTNVLGTAVLLDAIRNLNHECTVVLITSDKAYDNVEWIWGYRENDRMGGKDVYSGSKGAAELIIKSYWHSFLHSKQNIRLGIVRAGNVIGGGDWSADRIVVDCIKALMQNEKLEMRSPDATRPWQHVLEPLSGYLNTGQALFEGTIKSGEAYNFGPPSEQIKTVYELAHQIGLKWLSKEDDFITVTGNVPFHEATLLKLNCDKALADMKWKTTLDFDTTVDFIVSWYRLFSEDISKLFLHTEEQILEYERKAAEKNIRWALK